MALADNIMMKQLHAIFFGKVQGVGFRYIAKDLADQLNIFGWVKNLDDDQVELLAEGDEKSLKELLDKLNKSFEINKNSQIEWNKISKNYSSFEVKYD